VDRYAHVSRTFGDNAKPDALLAAVGGSATINQSA
jgi:hypothetical protein